MPIDRDTRLIAELTPAGSAAIVTTTAATTLIPTIIQHLIGDLFLVTGRSMVPTFPRRCIVKYKAVLFEQLRVGDIPSIALKQEQLIKYSQQLAQTDKDYNTLQNKITQMLGKKISNPNQAWVHRIIKKTNNGFITKGDGNQSPDPQLLTKETYTGEVVDKVVLDLSGKITGPLLESLWLLLKNYKPVI